MTSASCGDLGLLGPVIVVTYVLILVLIQFLISRRSRRPHRAGQVRRADPTGLVVYVHADTDHLLAGFLRATQPARAQWVKLPVQSVGRPSWTAYEVLRLEGVTAPVPNQGTAAVPFVKR